MELKLPNEHFNRAGAKCSNRTFMELKYQIQADLAAATAKF